MNGVFISYRWSDSMGWARGLFDRLVQAFGHERVFMDQEGIGPGDVFPEVLRSRLVAADVVVVLVGPRWLDEIGQRSSIEDAEGETDWVAFEVATGLASGARVIPVLVDGARMPRSAELPEKIRSLASRNAVEVRGTAFSRDVDELITALGSLGLSDELTGLRAKPKTRADALNLTEDDWAMLLRRISAKACVPIIGPGAVPDDAQGVKVLVSRARNSAMRLLGAPDLPRIAQVLSVEFDRAYPRETLRDAFRAASHHEPSDDDPCAALASLRLPLYVTTTHDDYLASHLARVGARPTSELVGSPVGMTVQQSATGSSVPMSAVAPRIIQLFGSYDVVQSMIVTEDDFFDLLVRMSGDYAFSPPDVRAHLASSSLLFLGFDIADWRFRLMIRGLAAQVADTGN